MHGNGVQLPHGLQPEGPTDVAWQHGKVYPVTYHGGLAFPAAHHGGVRPWSWM